MSEQEVATQINKDLIRDFGYFESRIPLFRLILACKNLTEVRSGEFNEFYGDMFLRTTIGTMRTEKYNYLDNIWILERQYGTNDPSVKEGDGYEPVYTFKNMKTEERLPLRYDICKVAALSSLVVKPKKNAKMLALEEAELKRKRFDRRMDILSQETSFMSNSFHWNEAVILDGKSEELKPSPNLRGEK